MGRGEEEGFRAEPDCVFIGVGMWVCGREDGMLVLGLVVMVEAVVLGSWFDDEAAWARDARDRSSRQPNNSA